MPFDPTAPKLDTLMYTTVPEDEQLRYLIFPGGHFIPSMTTNRADATRLTRVHALGIHINGLGNEHIFPKGFPCEPRRWLYVTVNTRYPL